MSQVSKRTGRWKLQYTIQFLFFVMTLASLLLYVWKKTDEKLVREIELTGYLSANYRVFAGFNSYSYLPESLEALLDHIFTYRLQRIKMVLLTAPDELGVHRFDFSKLAGFSDLEVIELMDYPLTEAELADLRQLPRLKLVINNTQDAELIESMKLALPGIEVCDGRLGLKRYDEYLNSL